MSGRPGLLEEESAVTRRIGHRETGLRSGREPHVEGLSGPGQGRGRERHARERLEKIPPVLGGDEIEPVDDRLAAPERARGRRIASGSGGAQDFQDRGLRAQRLGQEDAALPLREGVHLGEEPSLHLRTEAAHAAHAPGPRGEAEARDAVHAERAMEGFDARPRQSPQARELGAARGEPGAQPFEKGRPPGAEDLLDRAGRRGADVRERDEPARGGQLPDVRVGGVEAACGAFIGVAAKAVHSREAQERRDLEELIRGVQAGGTGRASRKLHSHAVAEFVPPGPAG